MWGGHSCPPTLSTYKSQIPVRAGCPISRVFCEKWAAACQPKRPCPNDTDPCWMCARIFGLTYCRCAEAPAASSRSVLRNPAAVAGSESASRVTVTENCGDSGRNRTCSTSCRCTIIRALSSEVGSSFQWVRVVRISGPMMNFPFALVARAPDTAAAGGPAMAHHFQVEAGRAAEVGFKSQRFFLLMPAVKNPVREERPAELHGDSRILKAARRKLETGMKPVTAQPGRGNYAPFAGACCLHPAQRRFSFVPVVEDKRQRPESRPQHQVDRRDDKVNQQKASHNASSDDDGTTKVAGRARGPWVLSRFFCGKR